jgi:hypothetical protein
MSYRFDRGMAMSLGRWLVGLFGPHGAAQQDRYLDPRERQRRIDAAAADATWTADARLPPHQGGFGF